MKKCIRESCQKEFEPLKPFAKYCSTKCRIYHARERETGVAVISAKVVKENGKPIAQAKVIIDDNRDNQLINAARDRDESGINEDEFASIDNEDILKEISAITAEKIPKERDTQLGRPVWTKEQRNRIQSLKNKLK